MSYQHKNSLISLIVSLLVSIPYYVVTFSNYLDKDLDTLESFQFWGKAILLLIPIRIGIEILAYIIATMLEMGITKKSNINQTTDERDQLISLKSTRNAHYIFIFGFLIALFTAYFNDKPELMLIILVLAGFLTEIVELVSKLFYYKRGH